MEETRLSPENAIKMLGKVREKEYVNLFGHGTLQIDFYKSTKTDKQKPHNRDEIYVIISGTGYFTRGNEKYLFKPNEVIFVPANEEHRFEEFTDNFSAWVFFYGPEGGEKIIHK